MFLEILQNSQENICARISFLIRLQAEAKRLWHRCFPVNLAKFLRTPFLTEYLGWLLLIIERIVVYYLLTLLQALINVLKSFLEHTCFLSLFDS